MAFPKAGSLIKGALIVPDGVPIIFLYNPDEIPEDRTVNYEKVDAVGFSDPVYHYKSGGGTTFSWTMSIRNFRRVALAGGARLPVSVDLYIRMLKDLTFPIRKGGIMIDGPPTVLFAFGTMVKTCKIVSISVVRKKWNAFLIPTWAVATIECVEVRRKNQNRRNSIKSFGELEI